MGRRHLAREVAMQVLFEIEHRETGDIGEAVRYHFQEQPGSEDQEGFALSLVQGTLEHREEIDREISAAATNWRLEQMAGVERAVLRLALYELLYTPDMPIKAAINESIELAKTFGGDEAGRFVNGVLGRVASHLTRSG
jgi:N utilization substance protein B